MLAGPKLRIMVEMGTGRLPVLSSFELALCKESERKIYHSSFDSDHLSFANSDWKCNRSLFVSSPQRGEMVIAWRSFLFAP
jgi:hypothetical protein